MKILRKVGIGKTDPGGFTDKTAKEILRVKKILEEGLKSELWKDLLCPFLMDIKNDAQQILNTSNVSADSESMTRAQGRIEGINILDEKMHEIQRKGAEAEEYLKTQDALEKERAKHKKEK